MQITPLSEKDISNALAGDSVSNAFTLVDNPLCPQPISVVFDAAWDGGDVTITGTAANDRGEIVAWSEVVAAVAGSTVETTRAFATVTGASKATVGLSADTAQLRTLFPTQKPFSQGGPVVGGDKLHAQLYVLKATVTTGTVDLHLLFYEDGRWWVHPGGPLTVADTEINKSKVGRFVSVADPSMDLHLWLANSGTLLDAYLSGKNGTR